MSVVIVISMVAIVISLGVVFTSSQARKRKHAEKNDGGDGGTSYADTSSDCAPGDSGGCDGGGGGD
jgi:hypothetical protein